MFRDRPTTANLARVAGFTMAEMTVVLFVIGLAAAITLPKIDTARFRLDSAVREVHSVLTQAQRQAVVLQHDVLVGIDVAGGTITVHEDRNNDGEIQENEPVRVHPLPTEAEFGRRDVPELSFGPGPVSFEDDELAFRRDGSASAEGGLYLSSVRQMSQGGHPAETRALLVVRATGSVRCVSYRASSWMDAC